MYALIDCNNFFVSCERLFRPDLTDVPVAVLSNNDGCVVARSNEVKALDVPMGVPHFKVKDVFERNNVTLFSANFRLYGDMSQRVVQVLTDIAPEVEVYSVDESFLDLSSLQITDYDKWAKDAARVVEQRTGIPVSVGVAPTKTLAKLAAEQAKKDSSLLGGNAIIPPLDLDEYITGGQQGWLKPHLCSFPVEDIWGIGRKYAPQLRMFGIKTAWDLVQLKDSWIKAKMSIRGLRTVKELRAQKCLEFGAERKIAKSVSSTRSFGASIGKIHELESAVASLAFRASYRLRRQDALTGRITVYVRGGKKAAFSGVSTSKSLEYPTSDASIIIKEAIELLVSLHVSGRAYKSAGIILTNIVDDAHQQIPLIGEITPDVMDLSKQRMSALDAINKRWGSGTIRYAVQDSSHKWQSKRENVSQAYSTSWENIPVIK